MIFARVAPEHKMEVVSALKDMEQIVAVTGDGVNDAPALKKADIGVAMGLTGTDVSREAAIMILLDDSFASIVKAVEQGRGVYANVKKMVTYIFSHNMAELFPFVFATVAGVNLVPLGALQVLAIDLGSDVLPGLALGTEHPEPGVMEQPPRSAQRAAHEPRRRSRRVVFIGAIQSVFAVAGFLYVLLSQRLDSGATRSWMDPASPHYLIYREALTMTQAAIVAGQFANGFGCRTETRVAVQGRRLHATGSSAQRARRPSAIMAAISYVPFLQDIFKTGAAHRWRLGVPGGRERSPCSSPRKRENGSCAARSTAAPTTDREGERHERDHRRLRPRRRLHRGRARPGGPRAWSSIARTRNFRLLPRGFERHDGRRHALRPRRARGGRHRARPTRSSR